MYVRRLRSSVALAVVAVTVGALALPMAAKAFQVIWPQHSAKVADLATGLDNTFKALAVEPQGSLNAADVAMARPQTSFSTVRYMVSEPDFGQVFASVSTVGRIPLSLQRSRETTGTDAMPGALAGEQVSREAVALSTQSASLPRFGNDETVALALLFSGNAKVSDRQLVRLTSGSAPNVAQDEAAESCGGRRDCTTIEAPVPGAIWLVLSALLGLIGVGYRRRDLPRVGQI